MRILFISDLHSFHRGLTISKEIEMIICGGDVSNPKSPVINANEVFDFIEWFESLDCPNKIWIAGNHDTSIEKGLVKPKELCKTTIYLEHEFVECAGIKIFGSPYTPQFGDWAFNVRRDQLHEYWKDIPKDLDILITHGPPKGIMDMGDKAEGGIEYCGDRALLRRIEDTSPRYHIFGHIHDNGENINKGIRVIPEYKTTFINASCVTDGKFKFGLTSQGILIDI